jgi:signal peptidase I
MRHEETRMASTGRQEGRHLGDGQDVFWALVIAGVFRTLFFQPFWIPSGSMKETLLIGDFLFVNKMAYGYSRHSCPFSLCPIDRPHLRQRPRARRHRGVPPPGHGAGFHQARDRPARRPGADARWRVWLNGQPVPQEPAGLFEEPSSGRARSASSRAAPTPPWAAGGTCLKERFTETLPSGRSYTS